jgi:hypothetical protein
MKTFDFTFQNIFGILIIIQIVSWILYRISCKIFHLNRYRLTERIYSTSYSEYVIEKRRIILFFPIWFKYFFQHLYFKEIREEFSYNKLDVAQRELDYYNNGEKNYFERPIRNEYENRP